MQGQKSHTNPHGGGWFKRELKIFGLFLTLVSFSNLIFSNNTFALFTPTLSASVDQTNLQVNGNQVINSTDKTTEIPFRLVVDTNNRTGYTISVNTETENTALSNTSTVIGSEIRSITENLGVNNLPNNTWGIKVGDNSTYAPIPALSTPSNLVQTDKKTNGSEANIVKVGMKLGENLEAGTYSNKLIFSFISNPYEKRAVLGNSEKIKQMTNNETFKRCLTRRRRYGSDPRDFEIEASFPRGDINSVRRITFDNWDNDRASNNLESHCYQGSVATSSPSQFRIEDVDESDYPVYGFSYDGVLAIWADRAERIYLNSDSSNLFSIFGNVREINNMNKLNTELVTDMSSMFKNNSHLENLDLSSFNTKNVTNMTAMFFNNSALTSLDLSSFDTGNVKQMSGMFQGVSKVPALRLNNFNTGKVEDMNAMFAYMDGLEDLDVSSFDTRRVTNMYGMFSGAKKLRSLNVTNFNTSEVTNMGYMFTNMAALENLNVNNFNTSAVTNMNNMFSGMTNLRSLNLSNFDTSNVKDMGGMFHNMKTITELNLSNFNTSNVLGMEAMFYNMTALKTLDISNFETSQVGSVKSIFATADGDNLERIYVNNDFNTTRLTSYMDYTNMFTGRSKLRGGNGSYLSDPATADLTWLRVDRPGVQGYFTRKS